jgi:uncharacterized tellurite resistance protein B-like protein
MLDTPLSRNDFDEAVNVFLEVATPEDRALLLDRAERLIESDHDRATKEIQALHALRELLEPAPQPSAHGLGRLRGLLGGGSLGAFARELMGRSEDRNADPESEKRRAYATLFGALLYRVIYADRVIDPEEAERLRGVLSDHIGLSQGEADTVLRAIQLRVAQDVDRQRLCAEFNRITAMEDRLRLLRAMLELALSDGRIAPEEEMEIRLIANFLWIEVQDFVETRRSVLGS